MAMLHSKLAERDERERREEIARERGEAQDVNFGSQIRSYVLHPYTMVKDHRTDHEVGDANRVLDGDLDGFVRAYLLTPHRGREPGRGARRRRAGAWGAGAAGARARVRLGALDDAAVDDLVRRALAEDVGGGDVTTLATVGASARADALITQKRPA